ncbi:MAG: hypothetical protein ACREH8_02690 [Opitutaceae bacterium]
MMCHSREANFALTLHESQLNRGDQLARWERLGLLRTDPAVFARGRDGNEGSARFSRQQPDQRRPPLSPLLPRDPETLGRFPPPGDAQAASLEARARIYLGVNCAHCHTQNGGGNSAIEFDWRVSMDRMRAIDEPPQHGDFELKDARVIAPGAASRSVIVPRVAMRGPGQMAAGRLAPARLRRHAFADGVDRVAAEVIAPAAIRRSNR